MEQETHQETIDLQRINSAFILANIYCIIGRSFIISIDVFLLICTADFIFLVIILFP